MTNNEDKKNTFDNPDAGGSNEFNNGPIVERLGLH